MDVLMTGTGGFVGREVASHFLDSGYTVVALGRSNPQLDLEFVRSDITDMKLLRAAVGDRHFDAIVHLASLPGDTGDPAEMVSVNVNGCLNLLEVARKTGVSAFALASSISAYEWYPATEFSPPKYLPVDEEHPCNPKDMYSTSKYMQELLGKTFFHQYGISACALRLTAVIGPDGRGGGRGWREIAEEMAQGRRVRIPHFSPDEVCHYVDIRDVARMFVAALEHQSAAGEVFNCCGPRSISGRQFAETMQAIIPGIEVEYGFPWSMAQGGELVFSMTKAQRLLDYEPHYDVADSLQAIKEWIDSGGLGNSESAADRKYGSGVANKESD